MREKRGTWRKRLTAGCMAVLFLFLSEGIVCQPAGAVSAGEGVRLGDSGSLTAGDVNCDGVIDGRDLLHMMKYWAGQTQEAWQGVMDVNGDGVLDGKDLVRMHRVLAGEAPAAPLVSAAMPRLDVTTEQGAAVQSFETYTPASVTLSECASAYAFEDLSAGIRLRGNSTAAPGKKPYRLKFDSKQSMLGLNDGRKFKSWVLLADYYDASMMRTYAAFGMAEALLDDRYYSSDCAHVELYLNGVYQGVYLLCEQTQIQRGRVNIPQRKEGDDSVEVGYLMIGQGGRTDEQDSVKFDMNWTVRDHAGREGYAGTLNASLSGGPYTEAQKAYVTTYVNGVFRVLREALQNDAYYTLDRDGVCRPKTDFAPTMTREERQFATVNAVLDVESAVRMCLLDEMVKNFDAGTFNMYVDLSPDGDGRLTLAAPWDFDFAVGNSRYPQTHSAWGYYATNWTESAGVRVNPLYVLLDSWPLFDQKMTEVWTEARERVARAITEVMAETYRYGDAYAREYAAWGTPARRMLLDHHCTEDLLACPDHFSCADQVHAWLQARFTWVDQTWGPAAGDPIDRAYLLEVDFTRPESVSYLNGFYHCAGKVTEQGLELTLTEAYDPYFYVDFTTLGETFSADEYPYLEIVCLVPSSNRLPQYAMQLFPCAGDVWGATGGVETEFPLNGARDQFVTYRIDLGATGFWSGPLHKVRIDFFAQCKSGDRMYLRSVALRRTAEE